MSGEDDYPETNSQDGPHLCESCLPKYMTLADRGYINDPFSEDVYHRANPSWMCGGCYHESYMDI